MPFSHLQSQSWLLQRLDSLKLNHSHIYGTLCKHLVSPLANTVVGSLSLLSQLYVLNVFQSAISQQSWREMEQVMCCSRTEGTVTERQREKMPELFVNWREHLVFTNIWQTHLFLCQSSWLVLQYKADTTAWEFVLSWQEKILQQYSNCEVKKIKPIMCCFFKYTVFFLTFIFFWHFVAVNKVQPVKFRWVIDLTCPRYMYRLEWMNNTLIEIKHCTMCDVRFLTYFCYLWSAFILRWKNSTHTLSLWIQNDKGLR